MNFKINDLVKELPDENKESRWSGRVVGFTKVDGVKLLIIALDKGFFSKTEYTPVFISLMVVHPSNAI